MNRARKHLRAVGFGLAAMASVGCGGPSADLFAVTRSGTVPGANFKMIVRDDGTATCDGVRRPLSAELLIRARGLQADLEPAVAAATALPSGTQPIFTYVVSSPGGRASFSDASPRQPQAFYQLARLTSDVARQVCHLPR